MRNSKQESNQDRLKCICLNIFVKMSLIVFGFLLIVIIIISSIPSLLMYYLLGDYSIDCHINKEYKLAANHFNE